METTESRSATPEQQQHVGRVAERLGAALQAACGAIDGAVLELGDMRRCAAWQRTVAAALDECVADLREVQLSPEANRLTSALLWKPNQQLLAQGVLQLRAREKPLGYAGDFRLLHWIAEETIPATTPLGRAMDRYFQNQAAPMAVRARIAQSANLMIQSLSGSGAVRWLSVGAGPASDLRMALQRLDPRQRRRCHVTLWDLDFKALEFARERLGPWLDAGRLATERKNLFRLAGAAVSERFDYIVCSGLLDYLNEPQAIELVRTLGSLAAPSGVLLVHNFDAGHRSRGYMEWLGNWYLTYRDQADMRRLAESADLTDFRVDALEGNALWSLTVRKPASSKASADPHEPTNPPTR